MSADTMEMTITFKITTAGNASATFQPRRALQGATAQPENPITEISIVQSAPSSPSSQSTSPAQSPVSGPIVVHSTPSSPPIPPAPPASPQSSTIKQSPKFQLSPPVSPPPPPPPQCACVGISDILRTHRVTLREYLATAPTPPPVKVSRKYNPTTRTHEKLRHLLLGQLYELSTDIYDEIHSRRKKIQMRQEAQLQKERKAKSRIVAFAVPPTPPPSPLAESMKQLQLEDEQEHHQQQQQEQQKQKQKQLPKPPQTVESSLSATRIQARAMLAKLTEERFAKLTAAVVFEIETRFPAFRTL